MNTTLAREFIAHAPLVPNQIAPGLLGWVGNEFFEPGDFLCAHCAGRITARGFFLSDVGCKRTIYETDIARTCCTCGKVVDVFVG